MRFIAAKKSKRKEKEKVKQKPALQKAARTKIVLLCRDGCWFCFENVLLLNFDHWSENNTSGKRKKDDGSKCPFLKAT